MTTPTINVNLTPCPISASHAHGTGSACAGAPVLIPCLLPSTWTVKVALGECIPSCAARGRAALTGGRSSEHYPDCPARPVSVSCSIGGETWYGSEVKTARVEEFASIERVLEAQEAGVNGLAARLVSACRDRWALVKALVLGYTAWDYTMSHAIAVPLATITAMLAQRDTVFAALCDMARAEEEAFNAQERAARALGDATFLPDNFHRAEPSGRPSTSVLDRYLERLTASVGAL